MTIDLRSDFISGPTPEMISAMIEAAERPAGFGPREDATVAELERLAANTVGLSDALFCPVGPGQKGGPTGPAVGGARLSSARSGWYIQSFPVSSMTSTRPSGKNPTSCGSPKCVSSVPLTFRSPNVFSNSWPSFESPKILCAVSCTIQIRRSGS